MVILRKVIILVALFTPIALLADTAAITFGAGRSYFRPDIIQRQRSDRFYSESLSTGAAGIAPSTISLYTQEPSLQLPLRIDLTSNDLSFALFHRWSFNSASNLNIAAGSVLGLTRDNITDVEERYLGFQFGHRFYLLDDRLEIRPVWGFTQYVLIHERTGFSFSSTTQIVPATTLTSIELEYEGKSQVNGIRWGVEFLYKLTADYEISGGLYYMPSRSGTFTSQSVYLSSLRGRAEGQDIQIAEGAAIQEDLGFERSYTGGELTFSYLMNPYVSLNLTAGWERWTTTYSGAPFSSGFGAVSVTAGNQSAGGSALIYDYEPITDWLIYSTESNQDTSSIIFSVTFRTGEFSI